MDVRALRNEDATRERIEQEFAALAGVVRPNDVFVLYLAGHGAVIGGIYYFVPQDVRYENQAALQAGSLSEGRLRDLLMGIKAQKSVLLLDTCYAGAFAGQQQVAFNFRGLEERTAIDRLMQATGRATLAASTASQQALEVGGHGVFTYALLQGLNRAADERGNRNGTIEIDELSNYLSDAVPELTLKMTGREQFIMRDMLGQNFPIAQPQ